MRIEHDFLGEIELPDNAYYGVQTQRAIENFKITGLSVSREPLFTIAFAYVKKGAALANKDARVISNEVCEAICYACDRIIAGEFHDQFVTDMIQGGAGTSCNMNANEVIANVGLEFMGYKKGDYQFLHPNNHVNCSQSTNDAYPSAFRLALYNKMTHYISSLQILTDAFLRKGEEFKNVLKMGRTQLQDAVPMTLGREFRGYGITLSEDIQRLKEAQKLLLEINMGATAIGTGVNAPEGYANVCVNYIAQLTGIPFVLAEDLVEATSDTGAYVQISGVLKRSAVKLSKICNDLRLLSSGPRAGFNEINLPKMQPGSSIMPGKVNPVIPEVMNQVCYYVIGADTTITMAAEAGQLELNVMEPVIGFSLFTSLEYLSNACITLQSKCIDGITANEEVCKSHVMNSIGIITSLNPIIGYEEASSVVKECLKNNCSVHDVVVKDRKLISQEKWDEIYSTENLLHPKFINS